MSVSHMFDAIAWRYDAVNTILSLGLDSYWRKMVCNHLPQRQRLKVLDCATGTGEQLLTLLKHCPHVYESIGLDPAPAMLKVATSKLASYSYCCRWIEGVTESIPFPDHTFDAVTISFGIRNVSHLADSLKEIYRVLSPGGRFIILEFSHPRLKWIRTVHRSYLKWVVPSVGKWLSKNPSAYTYLSQTIESFPQGKTLKDKLEEANFINVQISPLSLGIVSIYSGEKACLV